MMIQQTMETDDSSTDTVTYTLTLTASEGGTVTPESGTYSENESVELLATPDSTYVFAYLDRKFNEYR